MRVCVLGHTGMLGHKVAWHLEMIGHEVVRIQTRFGAASKKSFLSEIGASRVDWCVNCIGTRSGPEVSSKQLFEINSELPEALVDTLPPEVGLVQASTDGVFRPGMANRLPDESPDATDEYGLSKARAEKAVLGATRYVIRCSIIGQELGTPRSLLSWFLDQRCEVTGYTNQLWNGITTLEWAKVCAQVIDQMIPAGMRVIQPGIMPPISKYDLLHQIAETWEHVIPIRPAEAPNPVLRSLVSNVAVPPLALQLAELHQRP
jgi:dTDP-4-dehydrorhamnose reductase